MGQMLTERFQIGQQILQSRRWLSAEIHIHKEHVFTEFTLRLAGFNPAHVEVLTVPDSQGLQKSSQVRCDAVKKRELATSPVTTFPRCSNRKRVRLPATSFTGKPARRGHAPAPACAGGDRGSETTASHHPGGLGR